MLMLIHVVDDSYLFSFIYRFATLFTYRRITRRFVFKKKRQDLDFPKLFPKLKKIRTQIANKVN